MPKPKNDEYLRTGQCSAFIKETYGVDRSRSCIYNWIRKGKASPHGELIKLRITKKLGITYTTKVWLMEFVAAVSY